MPLSGLVPYCFINLGSSLRHFYYHSGTVWVLNCKSLWIKDVNLIDFQMTEIARSMWLWTSPPHGFGFVLCPSRGWDTHCTKPRAPQRGIKTLRLFSKPKALPWFHLFLEKVILLLSWISEGQPCLCSVGGQEWAPGFPTHLLLLRREINMHRAAHTLVYSSCSCQRSCSGGCHALRLFWIIVLSSRPSLPLMEWEHKAQPCSVSWTGIRSQVTVLGQVSETGP